MIRPAETPPPIPPSFLDFGGGPPATRAADLPEMCALHVKDLFPDVPQPIYTHGSDLDPIDEAAEAALANVDMSMIEPDDTVNILCSEHGFSILNGDAYAQLIKKVRDAVIERTGAKKVRLALSTSFQKFEHAELIGQYGLDDYFEGQAFGFGPNDHGIPIETEIGTLYGVRRGFSAKRLIHVHYDDPREMHFHRVNGRLLKSFAMSYARVETRSVFHNNFPTRSANIVPRAIYESPYVRDRWAFSAILNTSPTGIIGVDADNDLMAMDRRATIGLFKHYGKMIHLVKQIDECITVHDDTRLFCYQHTGGLCACTIMLGREDYMDLENPKVKPPEFYDQRLIKDPVKAMVINAAWKFPAIGELTVAANQTMGMELQMMGLNRPSSKIMVGDDLASAMQLAYEHAGTDKALVFDGLYGCFNLTRPLAEYLVDKAPEVAREVDEALIPKWMKQRNLAMAA